MRHTKRKHRDAPEATWARECLIGSAKGEIPDAAAQALIQALTGALARATKDDVLRLIDLQAARDIKEHVARGGTLGPAGLVERKFLAEFRLLNPEGPKVTCGHDVTSDVRPIFWSPRRPTQVICSDCQAALKSDPIDRCDSCRAPGAGGFSKVGVPLTDRGNRGDTPPPQPPLWISLRICERCETFSATTELLGGGL